MLKNVHVKNLALISEADIDFGSNLNIMTGETGAGKSIILGSINLALGDKANKSFIRNGADYGLAELVFESDDKRAFSLLDEYDIPRDENRIVITRKITPDGSTARINGSSVTLSTLRSVTSLLVDLHGQHDHQTLLNPAKHLELVDAFGGEHLETVKNEFIQEYRSYKQLRKSMKLYGQNPEQLSKELSLISFELKEIEEAELKPNEDIELEAEYKRMGNAEKLHEGLQKIRTTLFDNAASAAGLISDAQREVNYLLTMAPELKPIMDYLLDLDSISRDLGHELSRYLDINTFDAERYHFLHERLNEINRLKSKYGASLEDIEVYRANLEKRIEEIKAYESNKEQISLQMETLRAKVNKLAVALSDCRKDAAKVLEDQITANLKDLNFLQVSFSVSFEKADKIYENGFDKVEFMISTNTGEPLKPLAKVASGGELSRIMLAIKSSIADADHIDTLIFDEIDTGISGRTAQKVAEKLGALSRKHQLICITHLPQIAAMADSHYMIEKSVTEEGTISDIHRLEHVDSVLELARLLSGTELTETSIQSAEELIDSAAKFKISAL